MVKDSRKNIAAELKATHTGDDKSTMSSTSALGGRSDSLVILDAHRRSVKSAKSEASGTRRGSMHPQWSGTNEIGEQIGKELRELYNDMLSQPIPDRFLDLLNELEKESLSPVAKAGTPGGG
jgi:hypothetical protein